MGVMLRRWEERGRILSWSSITMQWLQLARESRNLGGEGRGTEGRGGEGREGEGRGGEGSRHKR